MQRTQHPYFQQAMQASLIQPNSHQRRDSGYSQGHSPQSYGLPTHYASQAASPIAPTLHPYHDPHNAFMTQGPGVALTNSSMIFEPNTEVVYTNHTIGHMMQGFGSQLAGHERTTYDLCGRVDLVQSRMSQLESTVISFWRNIDAKLESPRGSIVEQSTTEIENIGDSSTSSDATSAREFGHVVTVREKPDTMVNDQEKCRSLLDSDRPPDTPTNGQSSSPDIFHGSLTQRLDCMAKLVSTEQTVQTAITDRFDKVFEMLQSVSDHSANVVSKQDLEALRVGISQDLDILRRALRKDLDTDRGAILQDMKLLVEEERHEPKAFREMKQDIKSFRKIHDQRLSTTGHQLNECLVNQTSTLETVRNSETRFEQELSSVRDTLTRLEGIVIARLPVGESQSEVVKERPPVFSFAQIVKMDYDPCVNPLDASEGRVRLQEQSPRTLPFVAVVAQDCNDPNFEIVSSRRERVGDRAKACGSLAESHSNEPCPISLAGLLQPHIKPTAVSKEESAQQFQGDVWTEARSNPDQEKRQTTLRAKHRADLTKLSIAPKQPSLRASCSTSSSGEPARGQILGKRNRE